MAHPDVKAYETRGDSRTLMKGDVNKRNREIEGVVFDLDDTLVESTVDFPKFKGRVIDMIVSFGEERSDYRPEETVVAIINRFENNMRNEGVSESEFAGRLAALDRIMDEVEMERVSETVALEGALRLLGLLRKHGVKIGVLTRGCEGYARAALSNTGLLDFVDAVECRNSDTKPKPSPEAYLKLAEALGVSKDKTIFVGDHPLDAQCAANAGVPFIAVRTGDVPDRTLMSAGCVAIFQDVGELADWFEELLDR